jgi:hypothetical protein
VVSAIAGRVGQVRRNLPIAVVADPSFVRTMRRSMIALVMATTLASGVLGCSVLLPIAAATSDVPPDRTPRNDRIALGIAFGVMVDSAVAMVIYGVYRLRTD